MMIIKKVLIMTAIIVVASALFCIAPIEQKANAGSLASLTSVSCSTKELPAGGGTVTVTVKISIKNCLNELWVNLPDGQSINLGSFAGSDSVTRSYSCSISPGMLDKALYVSIAAQDCMGSGASQGSKSFTVKTKKEDHFSTEQSVTPEKDTYYVGETITLNSKFKSSASSEAKDFTVYYYLIREGDDKATDIYYEALGDIKAKGSAEHDFEYTFVEEDIGSFRLGSVIKYKVDGSACSEWNKIVEFDVEEAKETPKPTATQKPTATPKPMPEKMEFTVHVSASETKVEKGDTVTFEILVNNSGDSEIDNISILYNNEEIGGCGDLSAGSSATIPAAIDFQKSKSLYFEVIAYNSDGSKVEYTDTVSIEVKSNSSTDENYDSNHITTNNFAPNANVVIVAAIIAASIIFLVMFVLIIVLIVKKSR